MANAFAHWPQHNMKTHCQNNSVETTWARAKKLSALVVFLMFVVLAGSQTALATIDNIATGTATYNGNPVISDPVSASVPVAPAAPSLLVTKLADDTTDVVAGQTVIYTYVVRNMGNRTLTNVSLSDAHNGAGTAPLPLGEALTTDAGDQNDSTDASPNDGVWSVLAPGDEITLTASYTVQQADVDNLQ